LKFRLIALALCALVTANAEAAELNTVPLSLSEAQTSRAARLNFRLVADQASFERLTQAPLRRSGMIASTEIAPNATLGLGFTRSGSKRMSDDRPGSGGSASRKAAVSFQLRF
jgi:hypothetical protein